VYVTRNNCCWRCCFEWCCKKKRRGLLF